MLRNRIAIVLDKSGSMQSIRTPTIKMFNSLVEGIRRDAVGFGQDTTVSLITFSNKASTVFFNADVRTLQPLTDNQYRPDGLTALFDGVNEAIDNFVRLPEAYDDNTSFVVTTISDGNENNSSATTLRTIAERMKTLQSTDRWSFTFQLPVGAKAEFIRKYGVFDDNVAEWEATTRGVAHAQVANTSGFANYFASRSSGQRSTKNFYTTNLATVTVQEVKTKLTDVSDQYEIYTIDNEGKVKETVEEKTGRQYVIGSCYYLLMKTETVQPTKDVLIMEKGKRAIWGGNEARDLIGLPRGVEVRVYPGNHSNYDIFVKSTSVNRILPRGTKILVNTRKVVDDIPTWGTTDLGSLTAVN